MNSLDLFDLKRREGNLALNKHANRDMKRILSIDATAYQDGALSAKNKELLGLATSTVLRCDDCITFHLLNSFEAKVTDEELVEMFTIAMLVGGSITIPHIRRALVKWDKMIKKQFLTEILAKAQLLTQKQQDLEPTMKEICELLDSEIEYYNWTGFYLVDSPKMLKLGPYVGKATDHTLIPFGKGICGQAAETGYPFVIDDVKAQNNYLACSIDVKSEIVIPLFRNNILYGEIDIDSHTINAFDDLDRWFLEEIGKLLEKI